MCRILCVRGDRPFEIAGVLAPFSVIARTSREFQGHGWGCAWRESGAWRMHHNIRPVWEDNTRQGLGETTLLIAHARSAFRDEGIVVENNMPFSDGNSVFAFNGELQGVRIKADGRIGAEKIYNYIRRFDKGDPYAALIKGTDIIAKRSRYVRAMNIILSDGRECWYATRYGEDPDYFQMHRTERDGLNLVCSEPFPGETGWRRIINGSTGRI